MTQTLLLRAIVLTIRPGLGITLLSACLTQCFLAAAIARDREFAADEYANPLEREMIEAAFKGKTAKVRECLKNGVRINSRYGGNSEFFKSEDGGSPVAGFNWTALMAAIDNDRFDIVEVLISKGASVTLDDGWGATPLYALADKRKLRREYDTIAALLIKSGADVNAKTDVYIDGPSDETVLHRAVGNGHSEIAKLLVDAGANVNAQTSSGETPLDYVTAGRSDKAIRALLKDAGAKSGRKPKGR